MENQNLLTKEELFESMKLCAKKCQENPELRAKLKNAPAETFQEITGKVFPKEGFKLTEEDLKTFKDLTGKELPKDCFELNEDQLAGVSGGITPAFCVLGFFAFAKGLEIIVDCCK